MTSSHRDHAGAQTQSYNVNVFRQEGDVVKRLASTCRNAKLDKEIMPTHQGTEDVASNFVTQIVTHKHTIVQRDAQTRSNRKEF